LASLKSLHACLLAYEVLLPYPYDNLFCLWSELETLTTRPSMPLSVYLDTKTVHCQRRLNYIANLQIVMDLLTSLEVNPGLILIENTSKKFNQKHEMKAYIFTDFVNHFTTVTIEQYVIKFVSDLRQVSGFLCVLWSPQLVKLTAMI
jgi:hypothetical protein